LVPAVLYKIYPAQFLWKKKALLEKIPMPKPVDRLLPENHFLKIYELQRKPQ